MSAVFVAIVAAAVVPAFAKGFLKEGALRSRLDARGFERELNEAIGMAMGCGGHVGTVDLDAIERELEPTWRSLDKSAEGRVDRRVLRYLVHRHFNRRSALHVRGFEPSRPVNASGWGEVEILSQKVPAFVESVLESRHKLQSGFDIRDAAYVVATIQNLIFDSESASLEKAYKVHGKDMLSSMSLEELTPVLESYLVHWFIGEDEETLPVLLSSLSLRQEAFPHWDQVVAMATGRARALQHHREQSPLQAAARQFSREGHNAFSALFSFDDAHRIVGEVATSFASFWESECQTMKQALVRMDTHNTGRVPLSQFYSKTLDSEWRFGESEAYLRELGALDETSWRGKTVIIPNYIQGTSNCIVSTQHYHVCCVNECESLLGELEVAIGGPLASPAQILEAVGSLGTQTSLDDESETVLSSSLVDQLEKIASTTSGGQIPLHGRLFAQWLHYAFPRDCPFPHKVGEKATLTPLQFGDQYLAQQADMQLHALEANDSDISATVHRDELEWMSQWSPEEELVSEVTARRLRSPWASSTWSISLFTLVTLFGLLSVSRSRDAKKRACDFDLLPMHGKAHFV